MKSSHHSFPRRLIRICLFTLFAAGMQTLTLPDAFAHRLPSFRYAGVVQAVDQPSKTITLQPDAKGKSRRLVWNAQTQFMADGQASSAEALKPGTPIKIRYVSTLFASETATEVTWGTSGVAANTAGQPSPGSTASPHHWWRW